MRDLHEVWGVLGPQIFNFMNDSSNMALLQRLLEVMDTGLRQQTPRGQKQLEAVKDFLDPSRGGYNWQEAHEDMGRLARILGKIMEVRGRCRRWGGPFSGDRPYPRGRSKEPPELCLWLKREREGDRD